MAEEMNDVQNKDDVEEVDIHLPADGEEKIDGYVSGNPGSEDEQVDMSNKGHWESSSPVADFEYENLEARYGESHPVPNEFNHGNDGGMRMDLDQEKTRSPSNDNENQGEMDELHKSSFEFKERNFHLERGTEDDSAHSQEASPPTANNDNQVGKSKNTFSEKPYESTKSPNGNRVPYSEEGVEDRSRSPTPHRRNHSSVPKNNNLAERISPTQTSVSPQRSRHKDGSRKRMARSPEPRYSPKRHRRHERSVSRSPVPRRDHRRDYRDRSRSRSPYMGDRHRSPRRRYSPRRRSPPGHHSRRHYSPRRRPWSPPPNRRTGLGKPGKNLFVAGFSFLTTERDLERKFSRFGRVRDVRIVRDKRSRDSRGFGFLSMDRDEDADAAIRALDETEWNGRIILVEKSKSTR